MEKLKKIYNRIKDPKIFFTLWALFVGLEYYILGPFSFVQVGDNLETAIARSASAWSYFLAHGQMSYWLPAFLGGADRLSNMVSLLELSNAIFILPLWLGAALISVGAIFIGGYYFFRLAHEVLGLEKKASLAAGVFFSLATLTIIPLALGYAILPFVLFYLDKIFSSRKLSLFSKFLTFFILGIVYATCTSLVLNLPFFSIAIFLWFAIIRKQRSPVFYLALVLFFLPAAAMKIQEALSLLANSPFSPKGAEFTEAKFQFTKFGAVVSRAIQMGGLGLDIAVLGMFFVKKTRVFWKLFILTALVIFGSPVLTIFAVSHYGFLLGPFKDFSINRFYYLTPFFSAVLAAYVLHGLRDFSAKINSRATGKEISFNVQKAVIAACLIIVLWNCLAAKAGEAKSWLMAGSFKANTYSPDLAALVRLEKNSSPFRVATLSAQKVKTLSSVIPNFLGLETSDAVLNITSMRALEFFRLASHDLGAKNYLFFSSPAQADSSGFDPSEAVNMNLLSLENTKYIITDTKINSSDFILQDTPSAASWPDWEKLGQFDKIKFRLSENFFGKKLLVYENKNYFPRFFTVKKIRTFVNEEALLESMGVADLKTLRENVFLVKGDAEKIPALKGTSSQVAIESYDNDRIKLKVESDGPAVLAVMNAYNPYWKATVNGQPAEIYPAYHAFMAIPLPEKVSEVELFYDPPY